MIRFKGKTIERKRHKVLDILTDRKRDGKLERKREKVCHRERKTERQKERERQRDRERQKDRLSKTNKQLEKYLP